MKRLVVCLLVLVLVAPAMAAEVFIYHSKRDVKKFELSQETVQSGVDPQTLPRQLKKVYNRAVRDQAAHIKLGQSPTNQEVADGYESFRVTKDVVLHWRNSALGCNTYAKCEEAQTDVSGKLGVADVGEILWNKVAKTCDITIGPRDARVKVLVTCGP